MSGDVCNDNRFEIIATFKKKLIEGTNIETSKSEMAVIDNILFRFWQMRWLDAVEKQIPKKLLIVEELYHCPNCGEKDAVLQGDNYCFNCGQALDWSEIDDE